MAVNSNVSTGRPCCPFVCLVPAAMPQMVQADHAMPMFMIAPMAGPALMPHLGSSFAPGQNHMDYGSYAPFATWASEASSQPLVQDSSLGQEAPQQLPMSGGIASELPLGAPIEQCPYYEYNGGCSQEEVPTQLQMDSLVFQAQAKSKSSKGSGTLRRRRGPDSSAPETFATGTNWSTVDDEQADQELDEGRNDTQARGIAKEMIEQFQAGGEARRSAVANFERLAFSSQVTSRAAQIILEDSSVAEKAEFATGLRGFVQSAVQSKHANHVVQKITEVMPPASASFVVEELKGYGPSVARHTFGCRVFCRILEHLSHDDASTLELVEELFSGMDELCSHPFGSFVVRHILEFGLPTHKQRVVSALQKDLNGFAKHKFGSHVVEAALRHSSADVQQDLVNRLLADRDQLMVLAANQFGRHVVRALLAMPGALRNEVVRALRPMQDQLKSSRFGKSVLQALRNASSV